MNGDGSNWRAMGKRVALAASALAVAGTLLAAGSCLGRALQAAMRNEADLRELSRFSRDTNERVVRIEVNVDRLVRKHDAEATKVVARP